MLEDEHREVCQADIEEEEFLRKAQIMLVEEFPGADEEHPLAKVDLPRSQPCHSFMATHTLEYDPRTGTYNPVPKVPQHERGD